MVIIDYTYFAGDINIAQLGQQAVQDNLQVFIEKYEPSLLQELLGYQLYTDFIAGLEVDPIDQKWIDLRDGVEYTGKHGKTKWIGLANKKRSLIANYVYYQYMRGEAEITVGSGVVTPDVENATRVSPINLQVRAWNEMVDLNIELLKYLDSKQDVYGKPAIELVNCLPDYLYVRCCHTLGKRRRPEILQKVNTFNL